MAKSSTATRNHKIVKVLSSFINALVYMFLPLWPKKRVTLLALLSEQIVPIFSNPVMPNTMLKFWCFGGWSSYRAQSATEKEKATILWIDTFENNSIFWDIGANIGVFSLYAGGTKKISVLGFEPSASNFAVFVKNIELNALDDVITPLQLALSSQTKIDYLHMQTNAPGNTGAQFGEEAEKNVFKQGVLGFSIDEFIEQFGVEIPNYIKIDVDGLEKEILVGAEDLLKRNELKSIAVELTVGSSEQIEADVILKFNGFILEKSEDTVQGRDTVKNYFYHR